MQLLRGTESDSEEMLTSEAGFPSKVMVTTSEEWSRVEYAGDCDMERIICLSASGNEDLISPSDTPRGTPDILYVSKGLSGEAFSAEVEETLFFDEPILSNLAIRRHNRCGYKCMVTCAVQIEDGKTIGDGFAEHVK